MKYIIMCGGDYHRWKLPKQLIKINGEPIVARTIRLLKECGVNDIAISSHNTIFEQFNVPLLHHNNEWEVYGLEDVTGTWVNAFYPCDEPVCYLLGDVIFSRNAIKIIVGTETSDIEFFASAPPFSSEYKRPYAEPFAFKVVDTEHFKKCIQDVKEAEKLGLFYRHPIAWELWQIIKGTPVNFIDYSNYTVINDYTCDIDWEDDVNDFVGIDLER